MMQHRIDVVEDVSLADVRVVVVGAKFVERPVGNVLPPIRAVLVVAIERETVTTALRK
jgi:hypothetical protein